MKNSWLIIGGSNRTQKQIDAVAETVVNFPLAPDAFGFLLTDVVGSKRKAFLRRVSECSNIVTEGNGIRALQFVPADVSLNSLWAFNPTEPHPVLERSILGLKNTARHLAGETQFPRLDHLKVAATNLGRFGISVLNELHQHPSNETFSTIGLLRFLKFQVERPVYFLAEEEHIGHADNFEELQLSMKRIGGIAAAVSVDRDELVMEPEWTLDKLQAAVANSFTQAAV